MTRALVINIRTVRAYYYLAKPGIVYGNALAAIGGFFLASHSVLMPGRFAAMLVGISLVMGSACVLNNYIDRGIDERMSRTKRRALVRGTIPVSHAMVYAAALGVIGFGSLWLWTNVLTAVTAFIGYVVYVAWYGYEKRRSEYGTLVGSISGAVPPVVGYVAVSGRYDLGALLVFLALVTWQMPHFYAIAIYRMDDYAAAGIPVLPRVRGIKATKYQILAYIGLFIGVMAAMTVLRVTGLVTLGIMLLLSSWWLKLGFDGFRAPDDGAWARRLFLYSLVVLVAFSVLISLDAYLP